MTDNESFNYNIYLTSYSLASRRRRRRRRRTRRTRRR